MILYVIEILKSALNHIKSNHFTYRKIKKDENIPRNTNLY